ncbi:MAG: cupin domain-containing protein [Cyclobacteriaceae bacterium]|nr:cupin domain-containing protein [Cyclobacteriaceae bacterium]UYN87666.1 MAG: cupin domain-containing protein [Cyclobacteriaceae bacterium]
MRKRVFINPQIGDKATLIKSAEETNGEYSLIEIELVPGGGNMVHAHDLFSESFRVLEGELSITVDQCELTLHSGDAYTVEPNHFHCFRNKTENPVKFIVTLTPGHIGFEKSLAIAYGLAEDGEMNKDGIPNKFSHLSILAAMGGTKLPGPLRLMMPIFKMIALFRKRTALMLEQKYCHIS